MGIFRNSIDIIGITPENELPRKINGQLVEYSELDYILLNESKKRFGYIQQIEVSVDVKGTRTIKSPNSKIIVVDGIKNFKILSKIHSDKVSTFNIEMPYNTFLDLPKEVDKMEELKIYIVDAYFQLVHSKKIYSHILYMINAKYKIPSDKKESKDSSLNKNSNDSSFIYVNGY